MKSCKGKFVLYLLICLVMILGARTAFAATVSIPTGLEGIVDTTVMVPVKVNEAVPLSAYNLEVGYDPDVLAFVGLIPIAVSDKDSSGWFEHPYDYDYLYNDDPNTGEVNIGVLNFYPVEKSGILMYLKFMVLAVATDSPLTIYIVTDPGNDLSGAMTSAGSITTSATAPAQKCEILAVMDTTPNEVLVNLMAEGVGITQSYLWTKGDDPDVIFIVDPGTYQIVAQSEGYVTYYSSDLDCNQNWTNVVINMFDVFNITDIDGDGHFIYEGDCDDKDATVYPGAHGTHEGKDNNCNGIIDEDEKRKTIYPTYTTVLLSGSQYQQLWRLSFIPLYLERQEQVWYGYQYALYQQQLTKFISPRNQFLFSITQPYWHQPYLQWYLVGY